jgi:hypothetical protein
MKFSISSLVSTLDPYHPSSFAVGLDMGVSGHYGKCHVIIYYYCTIIIVMFVISLLLVNHDFVNKTNRTKKNICNWKNPIKIGNYLWCFGRVNSSGTIKADRRIIFYTNDKISHE